MSSLKQVICMGLVLALALSFYIMPVGAREYNPDEQNAITAYALSFEGNPDVQYVWGGYGGRKRSYNGEVGENNGYWSLEQCIAQIDNWSPNHENNEWKPYGTDCSGFLMAVFQHFGIYPPSNRFQDYYREITEEEGMPGDVVTYASYNEETGKWEYQHVAMYIGNGLIIHLSTRYGYTGRETPYDGYSSSEKKSTPTYPHISHLNYWPSAKRYWCRVVEDWSVYSLTEEEQEVVTENIGNATVHEWDLEGMPVDGILGDDTINLVLPDRENLSNKEINSLVSIKDSIDGGTVKVIEVVGALSMFFGLFLVVYSILLIIGYAFDSVNVFVDIDTVGLLTFGHIRIVQDLTKMEDSKSGWHPVAKLFATVGVVGTVGLLFLSGSVMKLLYWLVSLL